ncbi:MAG: hypothetical protein LBQ52_00900 [Helicobacteraceae bacterium]|nr:hypothetical protein [Helicobacteraceae bacterium]
MAESFKKNAVDPKVSFYPHAKSRFICRSTQKPVTNTYSYSTTYKKIYLDIWGRKQGREESEVAWSGFASQEIDEYNALSGCIVDVLIQLIGKNTNGNIEIERFCNKQKNK